MPITKKKAHNLGGRKALQCFFVVFALFEAFMLLIETDGDFANGILFFISNQSDSFTLSVYALALLLSFFFGRLAGKKILIDNKNHIQIALLYAVTITALLLGFLYAFAHVKHIFLERLPLLIGMPTAIQLVIWLSTAWAIKRTTLIQD
jgi:hypothetical protein